MKINYINADQNIFGPNVAPLKGKTALQQPKVVMKDIVSVPRKILQLNQRVTISTNFMIFNGLNFVVIISLGIKFTTVEYVPLQIDRVIAKSLNNIYDLYIKRDFEIELFLMDR